MDPVFEIITDQLSNYLLLFFFILFFHYFCFCSFLIILKKVSMDPIHDRGCMDPVHESGLWTRAKVGFHGPLVHNRLKFDSCIFHSVVQ